MPQVPSFLASDTLNMQLMEKDGKIWGAESKPFSFLTWKLNVWQQAQSDIVDEKYASLWVSISKRVWFYLIIGKKTSHIIVFDAIELLTGTPKLPEETMDAVARFGGVSIKETVTKIQSSIKGIFKFSIDTEKWAKMDDKYLDQLIK
jgi:hypothetical protein